jgi:YHS domain-containing protein
MALAMHSGPLSGNAGRRQALHLSWAHSLKYDYRKEVIFVEKDPVCGMNVDKQKAAGQSEHQGKTYYFCSPACKQKFDKEPARYAGK